MSRLLRRFEREGWVELAREHIHIRDSSPRVASGRNVAKLKSWWTVDYFVFHSYLGMFTRARGQFCSISQTEGRLIHRLGAAQQPIGNAIQAHRFGGTRVRGRRSFALMVMVMVMAMVMGHGTRPVSGRRNPHHWAKAWPKTLTCWRGTTKNGHSASLYEQSGLGTAPEPGI
ncbi:hypothetical protein [Candidatus Aalborgicola defluviihabitans]|uniref:hypothetical protein n=1 Tax=Candidatus Aalborgicola defluviihabitans TaxID=3386187 RepID=UPI001D1C2359|nr:winged helix-turn-helix domain-containing protein [Burkholderiales bacterium]